MKPDNYGLNQPADVVGSRQLGAWRLPAAGYAARYQVNNDR